MKITFFSAQAYDRKFFDRINAEQFAEQGFVFDYQQASLTSSSVALAAGSEAVCVFVNDQLDADVLEGLSGQGVKIVLLRCAGFNQVDLAAAQRFGVTIARVPAYSPEAVAEHTIALIMTLNRHTHRAFNRVREGNFSLDGLLGKNMSGRTFGIVGTGKIGMAVARIVHGFGCHVLAYDPVPAAAFSALGEYVGLDELLGRSDIVSLHCPLAEGCRHMIDARALALMKSDAMLVNTSRGALIDTRALIDRLQARALAAVAVDVYEQEGPLFFQDHSFEVMDDEVFQRLLSFPNVLVTGHQGFFTTEAMTEIAQITLNNLSKIRETGSCLNCL
ncbi:MAG: 2-hydroxyacid dehydrogenase [Pseudomonadota bacterium]